MWLNWESQTRPWASWIRMKTRGREVESTSVRLVVCDDCNFSYSPAKSTATWQVFSLRSRTMLSTSISNGRSSVDKKVCPGHRFASTVLASIELVGPALPKHPAKRPTTSYSRGLSSLAIRSSRAPTSLTVSLRNHPPLQLSQYLLSSFLSGSLSGLGVEMTIPRRWRRSDPTFA